MNNEQTHIEDSTIEVEEEKQSVEDTTDVAENDINETETEEETTSDAQESEQTKSPVDESPQEGSTEDSEQIDPSDSDPSEDETDIAAQNAEPDGDPPADESDGENQTHKTDNVESEVAEDHITTVTESDSETPTPESDDVSQSMETDNEESEEQATMTQESLEEAYDNSLKAFTDGEIVKGTVVDVNRDEVMIDIGFKSEGYIPSNEFEIGENDLPNVQVGDEIDVYIVRREDSDGQIVLSKKIADQTLVWDEITQAFENGSPVEGRVTERIKGGLRVSVGSLRGFLPASQVDLRPIQDLDQYIDEVFQMKIISMSKRRHNIVLSRRAWLEAEIAEKKEQVLNTLEVGQLITGIVKNITAFGAFVDLGGVDGLLHKTDMAWKRINHPSEILNIDDEIEVQVIAISIENEKISLGLKQKTPDPWETVEEKYPIGSKVKGEVVNIVNYGVFVQLEEAVEGLIHVSEMAWTRRNVAPSRIVSKGEEIEAIVLEISKEEKRISLGIKQLQQNPWELLEQRFPVGTKITGRIRNLTNFGAFVEIEEGIDGLIHTSDLSWTDRSTNPQELLKEGDEVEVVVLQIDASERRVSLGLKQTQPDPWEHVPEKYKVGSIVRGQIVNLTSFGAFTKLEEGIDGLIHISEIADRRIERPDEVLSVGDELDVKVINLDPKGRRIGLSLKAAKADQERATTPQEERPERRRRQRPAPIREPKQTKPVEVEETVMGALLKQEIDKNNAENLLNSQKEKDTESSETQNETESISTPEEEVSPDTTAVLEIPEPSEDTDSDEEIETIDSTESSEDTEDTETPDISENSASSEDADITEAHENTESETSLNDTDSDESSDSTDNNTSSEETDSVEVPESTETVTSSEETDSAESSDGAEPTES